jgi:hypothetical protein
VSSVPIRLVPFHTGVSTCARWNESELLASMKLLEAEVAVPATVGAPAVS